jgi:HlyD family secretion protein
VHQLTVHTVGGVVGAGDVLMLIVPDLDEILIEAQVRPQDIDQVHVGQQAIVRFPAFERRTTLELFGEVEHVSADLTQSSADRPPYFAIRLRLTESELKKLGDNKLKPGMPAEAFIQTRERTPMSYLLQPLTDQIARTFREG